MEKVKRMLRNLIFCCCANPQTKVILVVQSLLLNVDAETMRTAGVQVLDVESWSRRVILNSSIWSFIFSDCAEIPWWSQDDPQKAKISNYMNFFACFCEIVDNSLE